MKKMPPGGTSPARRRDRAATAQAVLEAAKRLLAEQGFQNFGINAVAKEAGCDKQLIYRYFGGLDGLVEAVGDALADWVDAEVPPPPPGSSYAAAIEHLLRHYAAALDRTPLMLKLLVWELAEDSEVLRKLADARSNGLRAWTAAALEHVQSVPKEIDAPAVNAMLIAAVHQLIVSRHATGRFAGMSLAGEEGLARMLDAIAAMVRRVYAATGP